MDAANDIAEFLTTRRVKITPDQAGLSSYGKRRVSARCTNRPVVGELELS